MRNDTKAILWLTAAACLIGASLAVHEARNGDDATQSAHAPSANAAPRIALPADATIANPKPFHLDAAIARAAVRDGTLQITLPDGRVHAIAIERQFTDETGHWNVVGRAPTRLGAQAMVLTFGANAVFGRIPMPDGGALHVTTAPGDRIVVAPDGGIVPPRFAPSEGRTDVMTPRDPALATRSTSMPLAAASARANAASKQTVTASAPNAVASMPLHIDTTSSRNAANDDTATTLASATATPDTTPVTINLVTAYTPEQITLRGTGSAVYTEIANLVAITNQAHIDSGSRVRVRTAKVIALAAPAVATNTSVLESLAYADEVAGVSLETVRDQNAGDLVTVLRPHVDTDGTCGVAYMPGPAYGRTIAWTRYGYSVINVDGPCGTLVHAHELGHNLGSMHDRDTDTHDGVTQHGAYVFSSGYRTPKFATVMAYQDGTLEQQWIGRFSNPLQHDCAGVACGIAEYSDNTQSLNRMAEAIAAYRGTPGTLALGDIEAIEPNYTPTYVGIPVRLSGVAPTGGVLLQMQVIGGTATQGVDYELAGDVVSIAEGQREAAFALLLRPDASVEGDETILVRLVAPDGITVQDAEAVVTIAGDDPRTAISGNVWFPSGYAPNAPIHMQVEGIDGPGSSHGLQLSPPDFRYTLLAPRGMQVQLRADVADPMAAAPLMINEVRESMEHHLFAEPGVRVSGRLRAIAGMALPTDPVPFTVTHVWRNRPMYLSLTLNPPDFAYSVRVPVSSNLDFETTGFPVPGNAASFAPYQAILNDIRSDRTFDLVLGHLPSARICCWWGFPEPLTADYTTDGTVAIWLNAPAPPGGVQLRYRTVDGTAKAGQDYEAVSGVFTIPEGEWGGYPPAPKILGDGVMEGPEYFDVVIDQPVGAQVNTPKARIGIHADARRTGGPHRKQ